MSARLTSSVAERPKPRSKIAVAAVTCALGSSSLRITFASVSMASCVCCLARVRALVALRVSGCLPFGFPLWPGLQGIALHCCAAWAQLRRLHGFELEVLKCNVSHVAPRHEMGLHHHLAIWQLLAERHQQAV